MARTTGEKEKEKEKEKALQMERIYVAVRARPLSPEVAKSVPWQIHGNSVSLLNQSHKFEFDRVFEEDCKTKEVYEARTKDIVTSAVSGFNGTVFAYGQTSSGKTHTMKGSEAEPGIIPLAIQDLFHTIQESGDREFLLRMSYMEIYNEEINDLLAPEHRKLQIHESIERGIYVAGLKEEIVNCPEQVLDLMKFGESHRHIGETNMNLYSSRSHTIFRMIIESRAKGENNELIDSCDAVRVSVLNLVDLAGSERVAKTGAEGKRLKEGSHINKSLLTLGSVIQKLSEGPQSQGGHVPYRDSKLTRILQPALGGNANTAIICNVTLAQIHADETKSSLQFASRAKRVTNCVRVNEIMTDAALLKRQKKEIEELRAKLTVSHNEQWEEQILTLRNTLLQSELEKERISLELEEEKRAKAQREERLLEQARKIENLSSLVLLSDRDEKPGVSLKSQRKRRETWCPAPSAMQVVAEDTSYLHRASSGTALIPFETLMEEDESCTDEIENKDIVESPFPEALSLMNVTSRRKISSEETDEDIEYWSSAEKLNEHTGTPGRNTFQSLTLRESEAILVIKQLEDQIKLLELEKTSTQNYLDDVLKLATQQNNSFTKKYEEMQQEVLKAREEARISQEKVLVKSFEEILLANVGPNHAEVIDAVEGLELLVDQSKHSADGLISLVGELFKKISTLSKILQEVKSSADEEISEFKSVLSESEMLILQLSGKAKDLNLEKHVLESMFINCQSEIAKLKCDMDSREKTMAENLCPTKAEVLNAVEGLKLLVDQSKHSTDGLLSFVPEAFQNFSILRKMLQEVKSSTDEEIMEFKSLLSESEMLTIQLLGKAKELYIEKSILEAQFINCQSEIAKLKCDMDSREKTMAENVGPTKAEVLNAVEGLKLLVDQSKRSTDGLISFVPETFQNFSLLKKMLQEVKLSTDEEIMEFKSLLSESEMLTIQLLGKAKELYSEKSILEDQFINCQSEISKLKCDMDSRERTMDEMKEQQELEKEELCTQLVMMQNEIAVLSSSSLMREIESLRKELDRAKTKIKDTEAKLKTSIHEKIKLEGEKAQAGKEIKELTSQRTLLEREIRKQESKFADLAKKKEATAAVDHNLIMREYQNLERNAVGMEGEIASLEESLINTTADKEAALTRLEVVTSELEELSKMMKSAESEIESLKDEVENKAQKLKDAESAVLSLTSCCESLGKDKEEMGMQLTDALLEAEAQKSVWSSKENMFIEATEQIAVSDYEIQRLSKDLSEAKLELEACRDEYKSLKMSSDDMVAQLKLERDKLTENVTILEAKIHNDLEHQLVTVTKERDSLMCTNDELCLKINEAEILRNNSDHMISQFKIEKDELMVNINALEAKIHDDLECQLVAFTKERDALMCTNEKMCLKVSEAEILKQNSDRMVLHMRTERDELAARISAMEAKMHDDESRYETELTECQRTCRLMQEKLDVYKAKYAVLVKEHKRMNEKFKEASDTLKDKLREYGLEILRLKKELSNSKSSTACASTSAQ